MEIGVGTFIDLTTPADLLVPYEEALAQWDPETGTPLRRVSMPIPDMSVPGTEEMRRIMDAMLTTQLMYPGSFILRDCLPVWAKGGSLEEVRRSGAAAYARNQNLSSKSAKGVFAGLP